MGIVCAGRGELSAKRQGTGIRGQGSEKERVKVRQTVRFEECRD
jgi:hypothetical protein